MLCIALSLLYSQSDNSNKINFKDIPFVRETNDEDIKIILKAIAKLNGSQIRIDEDVSGKETFSFNMPLEGAFNMIIEEHGLNYKVQDGVIIVSGSKIEKKILVLTYLKASKLKKLLNNYNIIDRSINKLQFGTGDMDNTVFIEGRSDVIKELETLIGQLEKAEELKQKEAKKRADLKKQEEEKKRKAKLELEQLKLKQQEELRQAKKLELEKNRALMEKRSKEQKLLQDKIAFEEKLKRLNQKMVIDVIPLKYINVSKSEVEFQGQKIQIGSIEDTLKGLLNSKPVDGNSTFIGNNDLSFLKIDQRTNSVIIKDFPERVAEVRRILKDPEIGLDKPPMLIEIEVTIAMGNSGFTEELGMKLGASRSYGDNRAYGVSTGENIAQNLNNMRTTATTMSTTTSNGGVSTSETTAINNSFQTTELLQPIGALGLSSSMLFLGQKNMLNFQLNAMENEGWGKVLSNPRIITLNNREATIISGNSVSIPTATADKMSLETIDTGISIKAKPHIVLERGEDTRNADILLDISIEKSSLGTVTREKIEKSTNQINSNVIIKNGQTLILGGLFQYTNSDSEGGIPILKEIPLFGLFFKTKNNVLAKNELVFFITPKIITPNMVDNMQSDSYMNYKKDLEYHKNNLLQKLNKSDTVNSEKMRKERKIGNGYKPKKFHRKKETTQLTVLDLLEGKGEEDNDY
jgi:type IV pilus assembly protein PilQ